MSTYAWTPPSTSCVRTAWLTLGGSTLLLEDENSGYFCTQLDLGYPTVRTVTNNRPGQHGIDDRTTLFGERAVTADITALVGAGARIDAVVSLFAPYMNVAARPVLHWILDRPGTAERVLTLRAAGFSAPVAGDNQRDIHLSWVAADPIVKDPVIQTATAWSGSGVAVGRTYPMPHPRIYPSGGSGGTQGQIRTYGDLPIKPLYRLYGPVTNPAVYLHNNDGSGDSTLRFDNGFQIAAGHFLDVDTAARTAYLDADPTQPAMTSIDWVNTSWPIVNPYLGAAVGANVGILTMGGSSTSPITQVVASWQDAYLT